MGKQLELPLVGWVTWDIAQLDLLFNIPGFPDSAAHV